MTANAEIGVKGWRNYSSFSLFASGSQRADKQTSMMVDTYSGNFTVMSTDWNLAARVPCSLSRAYNHLDDTTGVSRPFGAGWYWQFDMNLTGDLEPEEPTYGDVTWKSADGSEYVFTYNQSTYEYDYYDAPNGLKGPVYLLRNQTSGDWDLFIGKQQLRFQLNTGGTLAHLMWIQDVCGIGSYESNRLIVDRVLDGSDKPTATINDINAHYYNSSTSTWADRRLVHPTYAGTLITNLDILYHNGTSYETYMSIEYTYTSGKLTEVKPKDSAGTSLTMEIAYAYDANSGYMNAVYDTNGYKPTATYNWAINYTSDKVSSIVFPIASGDTGTVSYAYGQSAPTGWPTPPDPPADTWTHSTVTDARGKVWHYSLLDNQDEEEHNGRVTVAADPLWTSSHLSQIEYEYNTNNQVTSVKTPYPNAESGQCIKKYVYNANHQPEVIQDEYGFCSFVKYGSRGSYSHTGYGATVLDVIGIFKPKPNQQAYADNDHTSASTIAPTNPTISSVDYDPTNGWHYLDGRTAPDNVVQLVRTVIYPEYVSGTGRLSLKLTCRPENFKESFTYPAEYPPYKLTSASECTCEVYGSIATGYYPPTASITVTNGDLTRLYTPRQFSVGNDSLGYTALTKDEVFGVLTEWEAADSVANSAGRKTIVTHNKTGTRVVKVQQPEDNTYQWTVTLYGGATEESTTTGNEFQTAEMRPDIDSWNVIPIVSINEYDYNGNLVKVYQADPDATGTRWDGDPANGYDEVRGAAFDRINRATSTYDKVDWSQGGTAVPLTTNYTYDDNGNITRTKGPAYVDGNDTKFTYDFTDYDDANRAVKVYITTASTNTNLTTKPSEYTETQYDLVGNPVKVMQPLYDSGTSSTNYASINTFDWKNRKIKISQGWTNYTPAAANRVTEQHFDAADGVYWSEDGEGYKLYPEYDDNSRLIATHRGAVDGDADLNEYDADGNVEYAWTYQDVSDEIYRTKHQYDEMGHRVNSGRQKGLKIGDTVVWTEWNSNTSDSTFNYNGAVLKSYDKVNAGKFTEYVYDNWGQVVSIKAPAVDDPDNPGTDIVYETVYKYDVLGRRISVDDHEGNTTDYTYDVLGRTIEIKDAEDYTTATYFDARGNRWKVETSGGADYEYTYNERNLIERERITHDSQTDDTDYTLYDANGKIKRIDYSDGGATEFVYDELGRKKTKKRLIEAGDPETFIDTSYQYDDNDNLTRLTMPGGYQTNLTYDDLENTTKSEDPSSDDTDYTYDKDNRLLTTITPNGAVETQAYDWKTGGVETVLKEINTTTADDISFTYTFDNNGNIITITDGRSNVWTKGYDALGRMTSLTTPNPGAGSYIHTITYDGNNNTLKTDDFKGTVHYYKYDKLNRMTGHGTSSLANDETYTWACCKEMTAFTDDHGTASLSYDDMGRMTSFTDTQGNVIAYEYNSRGRTTKVTPPQGTNYRTEYQFTLHGKLSKVKTYDGGTASDTDYTYSTTSGKLTQRDFPVVSSANIRTSYTYDSAGRQEYETITREAGGTTNLSRTKYEYSYATYHRQVVRTEQEYQVAAWVNADKVTYKYDGMERLDYEERHDWDDVSSAWVTRYDTAQEYDKNGNRTRLHKNVVAGYTSSYGEEMDLSYTFSNVNSLTAIADVDDALYRCVVTSDANNNIIQVQETTTVDKYTADLYTTFGYDWANRMQYSQVRAYNGTQKDWQLTRREHGYDAAGRLVNSNYKQWWEKGMVPAGDSVEHAYAGSKHIQNYDGASTYGEVWHWAGVENAHATPVKSPNPDTASQAAFNIANDKTPQRQTWQNPTTAGDQRNLYGQGKPMAKDSSGGGADWYAGIESYTTNATVLQVESRLDFDGTVAPTDLDRATDAREKGRIGIFGSALSYAGNSGRVTSEPIGRDLNPLGRGDGQAYVAGAINLGQLTPRLPGNRAESGSGNSINNCGQCGGGFGGDSGNPSPPDGFSPFEKVVNPEILPAYPPIELDPWKPGDFWPDPYDPRLGQRPWLVEHDPDRMIQSEDTTIDGLIMGCDASECDEVYLFHMKKAADQVNDDQAMAMGWLKSKQVVYYAAIAAVIVTYFATLWLACARLTGWFAICCIVAATLGFVSSLIFLHNEYAKRAWNPFQDEWWAAENQYRKESWIWCEKLRICRLGKGCPDIVKCPKPSYGDPSWWYMQTIDLDERTSTLKSYLTLICSLISGAGLIARNAKRV